MNYVVITFAVCAIIFLFAEGRPTQAMLLGGFAAIMYFMLPHSTEAIEPPKKVVKTIECIDFRDSTKFQFTTDNILDSGTEFPTFGTWIKIRDNQGNIRQLFDSMHRYVKCEVVAPN